MTDNPPFYKAHLIDNIFCFTGIQKKLFCRYFSRKTITKCEMMRPQVTNRQKANEKQDVINDYFKCFPYH